MPVLSVAGQRAYYVCRRPNPGSFSGVRRGNRITSVHRASHAGDRASPLPVVFVHGAGGTHQHWLYQIRDLERSPTYAVDLPGHGRSDGPGLDSIEAYGDWLASFLSVMHLEKAILVGHSMGGAIALDVALRQAERVAAIGLIATGACLRVGPSILDSLRKDPTVAAQLICNLAFGPQAPPDVVSLGQRQMAATAPDVLYGDFAACADFDMMNRVAEIRCPACIVCGTLDRLTPVKYSLYLRDQLVGADLVLIESCGHMVMLESPQAVLQALDGLVSMVEKAQPHGVLPTAKGVRGNDRSEAEPAKPARSSSPAPGG